MCRDSSKKALPWTVALLGLLISRVSILFPQLSFLKGQNARQRFAAVIVVFVLLYAGSLLSAF